MDFFDLIAQRHSVRAYKPDPVESEKVQRILEVARLAPTAANRQQFKIVVIETNKIKGDLKRLYIRSWFAGLEAPLIIGVCSIPDKCWIRKDNKNYSDVDAAIVMDHIILAATALDLGTCWIGGFDLEAAREILELDESWEPVAFTPLGYAQDEAGLKKRKPLDELVIYK
ncbi:MAG: nitroreductase family protein [Syntrophomonas sp.]|nr:nitroreductase family protein [Syntrophomonas sp.]